MSCYLRVFAAVSAHAVDDDITRVSVRSTTAIRPRLEKDIIEFDFLRSSLCGDEVRF